MPKTNSQPKYSRHKASGQARVTIRGRHHYLGLYGSPESHTKYAQLIAGWQPDAPPAIPITLPGQLTVNELILRFLEHAKPYHRNHGKPTGEFDNIRYALRPLKNRYGRSTAAEFSARQLENVREAMIGHADPARRKRPRPKRSAASFAWTSKRFARR
jgi:hypothetical protein